MGKPIYGAAIIAIAVASIVAAPAKAQTFDFSSLATGNYTSVSQTVDGITLTLTRADGGNIGVYDLTPYGNPAGWGNRSTGNFDISFNTFGQLIGTFSSVVDSVSIEFGDYNADAETAYLEAFSGDTGTGTLLGSDAQLWVSTDDISTGAFGMLEVNAAGIKSFRFGGTGNFNDSLFADNVRVQKSGSQIPEPGSLALLALPALAFLRRRVR